MKKRIALALSMIMMILMLGACGTDPTTVDYNGHSYEDLQTDMDNNVKMVQTLGSAFKENNMTVETAAEDFYKYYQIGVTDELISYAVKWTDITEEFGAYKGEVKDSFTVAKSGETLTTDLTLEFEKKNVDFQVVYDYYSMKITGITIEPIYSLSEKMVKAGMNTLISITIVFAVLILISLLIACFNIFPYLEKKKAAKKAAEAAGSVTEKAEQPVIAATVPKVQTQTDDTELVAVIAAAIAASTGTSTSDFVVRSINRR